MSIYLLLTLGALSAFGPLTIDLYLPGFSAIAKDLGVSVSDVQYTLTSFLAGLSVGQLLYGPISDKIGRKKPLIFGIIVYIIASIAISFATTLEALVALRFIQALGSCVGMVITRALVRDMFEPKEAAKVFSLIILVMGVAPIVAPLIGSQVLLYASWRLVFIILAIFGALTFAGVLRFVPETIKEKSPLSVGFKNYYYLFFDKQFIVATIISGTTMGAMFSYISGSPFVFINIFQVTPKMYPLIFGGNALGFIVFSQINSRLLNIFSLEKILGTAVSICLLASSVMSATLFFNLPDVIFFIALFISIASIGFVLPNITAKALEYQRKRAAVASALMGSLQFLISSIGSILVTAFANNTAWPMNIVMVGFMLLSFLLYFLGIHKSASQ
ncbi:multidrug effflux MFS transporter [Bacteriovorax sp. Seq25_V]|uniref:multidrug effflux MFS transporter n=1 Tax=Bacteriovorax sp. Seq25_V TaxID=1201288 RepID=UPI00038A4C64|nr:multidrug effflux MFS transporter [Bacteriovorax sp. Seq25_V]EQC45363.1 drug resistance transporter, Bcr/CflA family [Bacteriovorax sp. Seq25_V]